MKVVISLFPFYVDVNQDKGRCSEVTGMNLGLLTPRPRFYALFYTNLYFIINEILVLNCTGYYI